MKNISVLGSTGSIGRQTLEVAAANPEQLKIRVLAAHRNVDLMLQQIELYHPDLAVLTDKKAADKLQKQYHGKTEILSGQEGLLAAATYEKVDTVLGAMVGYAGLRPTLAAINAGKDIALANKEYCNGGGKGESREPAACRQRTQCHIPVPSRRVSSVSDIYRNGKQVQ